MRYSLVLRKFVVAASAFGLSACATGPAEAQDKPFTTVEVARFQEPWAIAVLPGGRALITQKAGKLMLWDGKAASGIEVAGGPVVSVGGQGGLGDIVLHPKFAENGVIYLSWVEDGPGGHGAVVGRAKLVEGSGLAQLEGLSIIWRQSPKVTGRGHFGHRIAFAPDGKLFISSGERQQFDPAQDMNANLGKIIRLNDDGSVPSDNPYAAKGGVTAQIWSYGHRNPLGLAFAPDGKLWEVEMGPMGGDEVNLIVATRNYGYPLASNGSHYDGRDIPDHKPGDGFEAPKIYWNPSISPAGMIVYSGNLFPAWKGDAFIAALGSQALIRINLDSDKAAKADQWDMGTRIRDVEQGPDGAIWLLEDGEDGRLMRLVPKG